MWKNGRNLWSFIKVVDSSLAEIVLKFQQFFFLLNNPQVDTGSLLLGEENFLLNISLDGTEMGLELEFMVVLEHWQQHCQNTFQNFLLKQQWSIQKYFPFFQLLLFVPETICWDEVLCKSSNNILCYCPHNCLNIGLQT